MGIRRRSLQHWLNRPGQDPGQSGDALAGQEELWIPAPAGNEASQAQAGELKSGEIQTPLVTPNGIWANDWPDNRTDDRTGDLTDSWVGERADPLFVLPPQDGASLLPLGMPQEGDAGGPGISPIQTFAPQPVNLLQRISYAGENRLAIWGSAISLAFARDRDSGNLFAFVPVFMALGIIAYYMVPSEPSSAAIIAGLCLSCLALVAMQRGERGHGHAVALGAALVLAGMALAQWEIHRTNMPVPVTGLTGEMHGLVRAVDSNARGSPRYLVRPVSIEGIGADQLPMLVRASALSVHEPLKPGAGIRGLVRLQPVSGPAYPGGYDFAFFARMEGLGLSGFFLGAPGPAEAPQASAHERAAIAIAGWRQAITHRIRHGLDGEAGAIAAALITGDRSGLSDDTQEVLRRTGLAHILAISGLHMALVTLTVIWLVRAVLALPAGLAERRPIRKWAALAGFAAATLYLFLSGASVATQRAWIMISVMLIASLTDRRAITMRSVAIAAILVLAIHPSSLFNPGFQMSFAAVAALVAVYRELSARPRGGQGVFDRLARSPAAPARLSRYLGGIMLTSIVAGAATGLFSTWHFHRVALYGVVSNLAAMPIVSLLVMPLALFSVILMPYGLEGLALAPLGHAIHSVMAVAEWTDGLGGDLETGYPGTSFLLLGSAGLVLLCALRTRLRWTGLVPLALAVLLPYATRPEPIPDLLISQDGRGIAVSSLALGSEAAENRDVTVGEGEHWVLPFPQRNRFTTQIWQRAHTPGTPLRALDPGSGRCDRDLCRLSLHGAEVAIVHDPDLIVEACAADIIIAPRLWWVNCRDERPSFILRRGDLEHGGSHALRVRRDGNGRASVEAQSVWPPVALDREGQPLTHGDDGLPKPMRRPWLERFDPRAMEDSG